MKTIIDINNYTPLKTDKFIFDTNIWLYLYCPLGDYKKFVIKKYENFLVKIIKCNSSIFLPSLILSEFINRYIRLDFNIKNKINPTKFSDFKKDYRPSSEFLDTIKVVQATIRQQIIKITKNISDDFSSYDLTYIINNVDQLDYNDLCIEEIASISNYKVVTDDKDFKITSKSIEVLTSNPKLLKL